jgi:hypothetical protein
MTAKEQMEEERAAYAMFVELKRGINKVVKPCAGEETKYYIDFIRCCVLERLADLSQDEPEELQQEVTF